MLQLLAKAYCAPEAVGICRQSALAHTHVLQRYGIANITSARQRWWENPYTHVILIHDMDSGEPLGGVRLQRWGNGEPLPIEQAVADVDLGIVPWIASMAPHGVAEICGLWCSPKVAGFGLGTLLTSMGISLASRLRTTTLLGLCDTRTLEQNKRLGFSPQPNLAARGTLEYPRPGLTAHILRIVDTWRLQSATLENRAEINRYRDVPKGSETVQGSSQRLLLERDLTLSGHSAAQTSAIAREPRVLARSALPTRSMKPKETGDSRTLLPLPLG